MIYGDITNCSVVGHGEISAYQCRMGYQVISADANTNTRQIKLQLEARTISNRYATTGYQLYPVIDDVSLTAIGMNFSTNNVNIWQVLGTRIITITGAFNGTKYGSFTTSINSEWGLKSGSASVTIVLEDLHMAPFITETTMSEKNPLLQTVYQLVQYLSVKKIEFEVTTYDDATISSYQVQHNGVLIGSSTTNVVTVDFSEVGTLATYEMEDKTWATLKFVVIDSFGAMGSIEIPFEVIKYTKPNLVQTSSSVKRNGQLTGKVKLNLVGSFYNNKVNDIANTIKLEFAYWKKGGEESTTYYEIPFEPTGDSINLYSWAVKKGGVEITDVDKDFAYIFKVRATDHFNQVSPIELLCPVGEYLWAEFKDRVDFKNITIKGTPISEQFKQNIITAVNTTGQVLGSSWQMISLNEAISSGSGFSLTGGQIKIGSGITKVKISATISTNWDSATAPDGLLGVRKNGALVARVNGHKRDAYQSTSITASPFILEVAENDLIDLCYHGSNGNNIIYGAGDTLSTYMTIEELKV